MRTLQPLWWNVGRSRFARLIVTLLCGVSVLDQSRLDAARWDAIDPADLAATDSSWAPGADAEILIDRQFVTDETDSARFVRYQRIKVYTQKGVDDSGKFAFEYPGNASITGLEARVVKPDGREVELKKSDFFVSDVVRRFGKKWKKTSMVFPDLQPGDIVEYRWRETIPDGAVNSWDYCQRAIPVREYTMEIEAEGYSGLSLIWYNTPSGKASKKGGRSVMTATHLPAFEEEDLMVPMRDVRGWVWLTYANTTKEETLWKETSRSWESTFRDNIRPNAAINAKAAELIAGAATDDEKLERLYEFSRREISNYHYYESAEIQTSVKKRESGGFELQPARRILERGGGFSREINYLFASLCQAAGYEVRQLIGVDRDDVFNIKVLRGYGLLHHATIGVKVGADWRTYSPGDHIVPFGMLPWELEGTVNLISGKGDVQLVSLPASPADVSRNQRVGRFTLDEEGTLAGTVEETFTGHEAIALKRTFWSLNKEECRTELEKQLAERFPGAEITDLTWENLKYVEYPVVIRYQLSIPAYAEQLGERLMFMPAVFEKGRPPVFSASTRRHAIMFPYARSEQDDISIVLPESYVLDQPSAPESVAEKSGFLRSNYEIKFTRSNRTLHYVRNFQLGMPQALSLRAESYPLIKAFLDRAHASDSHALLIKPAPVAVSAAAVTP